MLARSLAAVLTLTEAIVADLGAPFQMMRRLSWSRLVVLILAPLSLGCWQQINKPTLGQHPTAAPQGATDWRDLVPKDVKGKQDPATLIAADGTTCLVNATRYQNIRVSDRVWCAWR